MSCSAYRALCRCAMLENNSPHPLAATQANNNTANTRIFNCSEKSASSESSKIAKLWCHTSPQTLERKERSLISKINENLQSESTVRNVHVNKMFTCSFTGRKCLEGLQLKYQITLCLHQISTTDESTDFGSFDKLMFVSLCFIL